MRLYVIIAELLKARGGGSKRDAAHAEAAGQLSMFGVKRVESVQVTGHVRHTEHGVVVVPTHTRHVEKVVHPVGHAPAPHPVGEVSGVSVLPHVTAPVIGGVQPKEHTMTETAIETVKSRLERLGHAATVTDKRLESLDIAHAAGVSDADFKRLAAATRLSRKDTVNLPPGRHENLSRGRGWARKGKGDNAVWGERIGDGDGYKVGPGTWSLGSTDGFRRKHEETWVVKHVQVGDQTWTVAS